jgi:(p)ppGpp synthase/HD superfamily hydrolase
VTSEPTVLTDRFDRALLYATHVHGGQTRKRTGVPYVAHLLAVTATVLEYGGDEDMAIAALLHDAPEDQGGAARLEDIRNRFGGRVAAIVEALSDSLTAPGEVRPGWEARKRHHLDQLQAAAADVLLVALADKVHNTRSVLRDLRRAEIGEAVWRRFQMPKARTLSFYEQLVTLFRERLPGQLADELAEIVAVLRAENGR